ncbi:30S ribosomal protein S6 [Candidatus Babeliales bacterium]|nr:30S ribosomal protein S6 [Candidatus Babeliales bacterium]
MMIRYETLMLAPTEITDDELSTIESNIEKIVTKSAGQLTNFDKWGKFQLAYPIKSHSYGVYVLARYEAPKAHIFQTITDIKNLLQIKYSETVIRHVSVRLDADAPTEYHRPDSLDAAKTGNLDSFLKENKIENLLDSVEANSDEFGADDFNVDMRPSK